MVIEHSGVPQRSSHLISVPIMSLADQRASLQMLRLAARQQTMMQNAIFSWTWALWVQPSPAESREIYLIVCGMFWYSSTDRRACRLSECKNRIRLHYWSSVSSWVHCFMIPHLCISHTYTHALSHSICLVLFHTFCLPSFSHSDCI